MALIELEASQTLFSNLRVTYRGQGSVRARVVQRWLLPERVLASTRHPR